MIEKFVKITVGFVCQTFERDADGNFVCIEQAFIAGDECNYEDINGEPLKDVPEYEYQPYEMAAPQHKEPKVKYLLYNDVLGSLERDEPRTKRRQRGALGVKQTRVVASGGAFGFRLQLRNEERERDRERERQDGERDRTDTRGERSPGGRGPFGVRGPTGGHRPTPWSRAARHPRSGARPAPSSPGGNILFRQNAHHLLLLSARSGSGFSAAADATGGRAERDRLSSAGRRSP